jgi:putative Holliday junction resolvase
MSRILGIDYGIKRIGLALSDPLGITARPLSVVERKLSKKENIAQMQAIVREHEVTKLVVGLPLNMDGTEGRLAPETRAFGEELAAALSVSVEFLDERLTTMQAERMLVEEADLSREKRKGVRDKLAASLILQTYLEQNKPL